MRTNKLNFLKSLTTSTLLLAATMGLTSSGCGILGAVEDIGDGLSCEADFEAKMDSLQASVDGLISVSGDIRADVFLACQNIANDLGADGVPAMDPSSATDSDLETACSLAQGAIDAEISAGVTIDLVIEPGYCQVAADAQISCEASCDVSGGCDPGSIDVRCEPGQLSGECSAECSGECRAEANVDIACEGTCQGTCSGGCEGTCAVDDGMGGCAGECEGTCSGSCSGTCQIDAGASVTCEGTCKGDCSVEFTAPSCEGELTPPSCDIDADCQAGCDGQAKFEAECVPPTISVAVNAMANASLQGTLEANLPAILSVVDTRGALMVDAAGTVATSFGNVVAELATLPGCLLVYSGDFAAQASASVEASASVSVSVTASASVGASAKGG
jgi:hypothetical protein